MASYFVTSFTAADHRGYAARFQDDLAVEVGRLLGGRKIVARACDDTLTAGERRALVAEAGVLVVLCSPAYYQDEECGRDWAVFQRRLGHVPEQGRPHDNPARVLVRWRPVRIPPPGRPWAPRLDGDRLDAYDDYNESGLYTVVRKQGRQSTAYRRALRALAAQVREGHRAAVPVLSPDDGLLPEPASVPVTVPGQRTAEPPEPPPEPVRPPRVFLSYAHADDQPGHDDDVRSLAALLRRQDIDVRTDAEASEEPQIWLRWMDGQLEPADFIIGVASPAYRRRLRQEEEPGVGLGATWEASYILDYVYQHPATWQKRILWVLFPSYGPEALPGFPGSASATHWHIAPETGAPDLDALVRYLKRGPRPPS